MCSKLGGKEQRVMHLPLNDRYTSTVFDSKECLATQYLALVRHPEAEFVFSSFHAGPGQLHFGYGKRMTVDMCFAGPRKWHLVQMHEAAHVTNSGAHEPGCKHCKGEGPQFKYNAATLASDDFNRRFAAYLSACPDLGGVRITYETLSECDLFHDNLLEEGYSDPKKALAERFPEESVLKPDWLNEPVTLKEYLSKLRSGLCLGSFVVITGGRETAEDKISKMTGFCLSRGGAGSTEELGEGGRILAEQWFDQQNCPPAQKAAKSEAYLRARIKEKVTLLKLGFQGTVCLAARHFLWLVNERKLENFTLEHVLHYEERSYHSKFSTGLLQKRHDLIVSGFKNSIASELYKLRMNATYGYMMCETKNYNHYTYVRRKNLKRDVGLLQNSVAMTLVGVYGGEENEDVDFIYMVKRSKKFDRFSNLLQLAAGILGHSRVIFYGHLYWMAQMLDPRCAELCYCDTDSQLWGISDEDLEKCVEEGKLETFRKERNDFFEEKDSPNSQHGKNKASTVCLPACLPAYLTLLSRFRSKVTSRELAASELARTTDCRRGTTLRRTSSFGARASRRA